MIGRQDNENLYLIYSDDLLTWDGGTAILRPQFPWELVQMGNCGSPIELVRPDPSEREGYAPNVAYTCGAMRHGDQLILPYAISDTFCNFAAVGIPALLESMAG
ncbi:MAG TPA: hypothetical protein VI653_15700 [Steroidobacteraceae bacterium]